MSTACGLILHTNEKTAPDAAWYDSMTSDLSDLPGAVGFSMATSRRKPRFYSLGLALFLSDRTMSFITLRGQTKHLSAILHSIQKQTALIKRFLKMDDTKYILKAFA